MRKHHMWIGVLFAGMCLYFACRGISLHQFLSVLSRARPLPILLCFGIFAADYILRTTRWAILIKPIQSIAAARLFWPMIIGFFANNVLPLRMGEIVRAHVCGTKFNISRTAALGSILLERICDTISFLVTFLVASLFVPFPRYMEKGAWMLGGGCMAMIIVLILIRRHESTFHAILDWCPGPDSLKMKIKHLGTQFIHSTSGMTQPRYVFETMALSLIIWTLEGTFLYVMVMAFDVKLSYAGAFFLQFALGLSVTLPQAPGYVGTFELFGVTALGLLGIAKDQALPVILAVHGFQFMIMTVLGVIGLWQEGLSLKNLSTTS